jgi:CRISPR-associated protein Csm2
MPQNVPAQRGSRSSNQPQRTPPRPEARQDPPFVSKIVFGERIDPKLYSDIAEEAAKEIGRDSKDQNKPSQLRRFYDELVMLQDKVGSDAPRFEQHQPFIQMLKAKVAYAEGRRKVDNRFASLLRRVVDQADNHQKLKQARLFMEAFMGFYKVYGPRD